MNLRKHNIKVLESLKDIVIKNNLSTPLIVSSNEKYLNSLNNTKNILYIGQETNGWGSDYDREYLENLYYDFLINRTPNKEYWKFLRNIRGENNNYFKNVIWSNTLICGKKNEKGTPVISDDLLEVSLENLKFLYKFFKPHITVIVSGPNNPYYEIIKEFLSSINSSLCGLYPKISNMLLCDIEKNVHYTYHPGYLQRNNKLLELSKTINRYYEK